MPSVGMVHGRVRHEERLLVETAKKHGIQLHPQHDDQIVLREATGIDGDAVLMRSLSATRALTIAQALQAWGRPVLNQAKTIARCMDKADTSLHLHAAGIPTPAFRIAFDRASALQALDELGYPAVLKPIHGSWARMVSRVRDRDEAEQLLEHREMLPNPNQHVYYAQEYIDKQRGEHYEDIRSFVIGDDVPCAVTRKSSGWVTNTARGATTHDRVIDDELRDLSLRAAEAVGGGIVAVDLMQGPDGLTVHEVNHSMEFRNSITITNTDIPLLMLQHVQQEARQ